MDDPGVREVEEAGASLEDEGTGEGVGKNIEPAQAVEEGDRVEGGSALGQGLEVRIPVEDGWLFVVVETLEDLEGVGEAWGEGADGGDSRKREDGERGVGLDEMGMNLFEFRWRGEVAEKMSWEGLRSGFLVALAATGRRKVEGRNQGGHHLISQSSYITCFIPCTDIM